MANLPQAGRSSRWASMAGLLIPALAAWWLASFLTSSGSATTPDSLWYLQAGHNLLQGHGVSVPDLSPYGRGLLPLTLWPPLYPIVLALFMSAQPDQALAASTASTVLLVVLAVLLTLGARRWLPAAWAAVYVIGVLLLPSLQLVYTYAWSETLCMPLVLGSVLAMLQAADAERAGVQRQAAGWLLAAGLAFGLVIWTRYAGVAFGPALVLGAGLATRGAAPARRLLHATLPLAVAGLIASPLLLRNLQQSGFLSGGERGAAAGALGRTASDLAASWNQYVFAGRPLIALLLVLLVLAGWHAARTRGAPPLPRAVPDDAILLVWTVVYLLLILAMGQTQHIDADARMAALVVPLFALALLAHGARMVRAGADRRGWLLPAAWTVCMVLQGLPALQYHHNNWRTQGMPGFLVTAAGGDYYNNFTNNPQCAVFFLTRSALLAAGANGRVFFDQSPMLFATLTGMDAHYAPMPLDAGNLNKLGAMAGAGASLILTQPAQQAQLAALYGAKLGTLPRIEVAGLRDTLILRLPLPAPEH